MSLLDAENGGVGCPGKSRWLVGWLLLVMTYRDASLKLQSDAVRIVTEDYESVAEHIYGHQRKSMSRF